jgi:predicted house-cleaning NTP pyrophosphatase (Maf/HAM1 superfamily)
VRSIPQGAASALVERIDGSVSNVIGLPLAVLDDLLARFDLSLVALAAPAR